MARNGTPRSSPTWKMAATWSCSTAAWARASRRNRAFAVGLAANSGSITLSASRRRRAGSSALNTAPIPPAPMAARTRYGPSRPISSGCCGGARNGYAAVAAGGSNWVASAVGSLGASARLGRVSPGSGGASSGTAAPHFGHFAWVMPGGGAAFRVSTARHDGQVTAVTGMGGP